MMQPRRTLTIGIILFAATAGIVASHRSSASTKAQKQTSTIEAGLHRAKESLLAMNGPDGRYIYRYNLAKKQAEKDYGWLRHAGTTYSLARYALQFPSSEVRALVRRSNRYLAENAIKPLPSRSDLFALISDPAVEKFGEEKRALLGGTGLGLISFVLGEQLAKKSGEPPIVPLETLQKMGEFLVQMQKPDGDFYMSYLDQGRSDKYAQPFFRGEAILGLILLSNWDPSKKSARWFDAAMKGLRYLSTRQTRILEADSWTLIALRELLKTRPALDQSTKALLISHAQRLLRTGISFHESEGRSKDASGCDAGTSGAVSMAGSFEGLMAAADVVPFAEGRANLKVLKASRTAMRCILRNQLLDGQFVGAVRDGDEIRIDGTQHSLSALQTYLELGWPEIEQQPAMDLKEFQMNHAYESGLDFSGKALRGLDLGYSTLERCNFANSLFDEGELVSTTFRQCRLSRTRFVATDLRGVRVLSSDLQSAEFDNVDLRGADFSFSDLRNVSFRNVDFTDANFTGAKIEGVKLSGINIGTPLVLEGKKP